MKSRKLINKRRYERRKVMRALIRAAANVKELVEKEKQAEHITSDIMNFRFTS